MKLLFSLYLLILSSTTMASQIVIYYPSVQHIEYAKEVKDIFIKAYKLPNGLIHLIPKKACVSIDRRFLELCIKDNFELEKIDNRNEEEIKKSLLIFSKTTEVSYDY